MIVLGGNLGRGGGGGGGGGGNFGRRSQLWRQFELESRFGPESYPSTRHFFLDFLLFFFYIVFFINYLVYILY